MLGVVRLLWLLRGLLVTPFRLAGLFIAHPKAR